MNCDVNKLADLLVELINSKPRSPTRDEILLLLMQADVLALAPVATTIRFVKEPTEEKFGSVSATFSWDHGEGDKTVIHLMPYKPFSEEMIAAIEESNRQMDEWKEQTRLSRALLLLEGPTNEQLCRIGVHKWGTHVDVCVDCGITKHAALEGENKL